MIRVEVSTNLEVFDAAIDEIIDAIDQNLEQVADAVYQDAKKTIMFSDKTGRLRKSISLEKSKFIGGGYVVSARGKNKTDAGFHAHLIEFGHVKFLWGRTTGERVAARPFMRQAKENGIRKALQLFRGK